MPKTKEKALKMHLFKKPCEFWASLMILEVSCDFWVSSVCSAYLVSHLEDSLSSQTPHLHEHGEILERGLKVATTLVYMTILSSF